MSSPYVESAPPELRPLGVEHGNAICYSGYREGQSPRDCVYPSREEIYEDLLILSRNWSLIRLYDCSLHAERVLEVIDTYELDIKVMLGTDLAAEMSNPHCPWGADFSDDEIAINVRLNQAHLEKLIVLCNRYPRIVFSASIGNEASVDWTDHMVSVPQLARYARKVRSGISQPVTFCENYVPWTYKLEPLVPHLDFISIHTYPAWEYRSIEDALEYTKQNFHDVARHYPDTPVIVTEAGWTTASNGRGIEPHNASEELQASYYEQLLAWTSEEKIFTFVFEAFDEPWKGSPHPLEPEKHWGLFYENRRPKPVMQNLYAD